MTKTRELDAEVAEKVMGLCPAVSDPSLCAIVDERGHYCREHHVWEDKPNGCHAPFQPSTSIADAWAVIEKMQAEHFRWQFSVRNPVMSDSKIKPHASFWKYKEGVIVASGHAEADSLPMAIALAALKSLEPK